MISESDEHGAQSDLGLLARWEADLTDGGRELKKAVLLELEARLLRLANSSLTRGASPSGKRRAGSSRSELTKVEQMAGLIAQGYTQPLTVETIANHVGLHPNYAMGLFRRGVGTTIVDYITKHRVSHAQRLLATTNVKIVEVALNSGFASTSRFNVAFRNECGCSPREYRQQHRLVD